MDTSNYFKTSASNTFLKNVYEQNSKSKYKEIINYFLNQAVHSFEDFDQRFRLSELNIDQFERFCDKYDPENVKNIKNHILLFMHVKNKSQLMGSSDYLSAWRYLSHNQNSIQVAFSILKQMLDKIKLSAPYQIQIINHIFKNVKFECKKNSHGEFIDCNKKPINIKFKYNPPWLEDIKNISVDFSHCNVTPIVKITTQRVFIDFESKFPEDVTTPLSTPNWIATPAQSHEHQRSNSILIRANIFASVDEWDKALAIEKSTTPPTPPLSFKKVLTTPQTEPTLAQKQSHKTIQELVETIKEIWQNHHPTETELNHFLNQFPIQFHYKFKNKQHHYEDENHCLRKFINLSDSLDHFTTSRLYHCYKGEYLGEHIHAIPFIKVSAKGTFDLQFKVFKKTNATVNTNPQ